MGGPGAGPFFAAWRRPFGCPVLTSGQILACWADFVHWSTGFDRWSKVKNGFARAGLRGCACALGRRTVV